MFFNKIGQSFEFAKASYRTLLQNPHLLIYPFLTGVVSILVSASFFFPLEMLGKFDSWRAMLEAWKDSSFKAGAAPKDISFYITTFSFYFCSYFVIIFFNTALMASTMHIIDGYRGTIAMGIGFASRRLPSIVSWALVSAIVGVIIRALEKNGKVSRFVSGIIGAAWTYIAYFAIPVIISQGKGPFNAISESTRILSETWGTALVGNFSLGIIHTFTMVPAVILGVVLWLTVGPLIALAVAIPLILFLILLNSVADSVFKVFLYAFATGETLPAHVDNSAMELAFESR